MEDGDKEVTEKIFQNDKKEKEKNGKFERKVQVKEICLKYDQTISNSDSFQSNRIIERRK